MLKAATLPLALVALYWSSLCPPSVTGKSDRAFADARFQSGPSENARPLVINSTYTISDRFGTQTYVLREDGETLTLSHKEGSPLSSIEYAKVKYVPIPLPEPHPFCYIFGESNVPIATLPLRSNAEAKAVAEYIAHRAGLELVVDAWRARKSFQCPEPPQAGCLDFKELLDHNDPEIAGYFYERETNLPTFACFSSDETRFFIVQYFVPYVEPDKGRFFLKVFKDGQEASSKLEDILWHDDVGKIVNDSPQRSGKSKVLGWIDSSSLSFHNKFSNKLGSTTDYTLDIRWSTGRYSESYSSKDDKGKTVISDSSGVCVKLN